MIHYAAFHLKGWKALAVEHTDNPRWEGREALQSAYGGSAEIHALSPKEGKRGIHLKEVTDEEVEDGHGCRCYGGSLWKCARAGKVNLIGREGN